MGIPKGRSKVNPGRRNAVTTPGVMHTPYPCTPKGRSGEGFPSPYTHIPQPIIAIKPPTVLKGRKLSNARWRT